MLARDLQDRPLSASYQASVLILNKKMMQNILDFQPIFSSQVRHKENNI